MKKMNNKGFSLVELIIVIAIMAVLIGVLAPQFIKYVERSRESTDLQNAEEVKTAVEAYVADHGESITDNVTMDMGDSDLSVTGGVTLSDLGEYGVNSDKSLKSKKWTGTTQTIKWVYQISNYTWSNAGAGGADYFLIDGTTK